MIASTLTMLVTAFASAQESPAPPAPPAAPGLGEAAKLKILYSGVLETPRAQNWLEFLRRNFATVGSIEAASLTPEAAKSYDVVITDANRLYPMDPQKPGIDLPRAGLGMEFDRPVVMIGAMGGTVQSHTKIDWL